MIVTTKLLLDLKPIMVIITNDEWDFCPLKNGHGLGTVTKEKIATAVNTVNIHLVVYKLS